MKLVSVIQLLAFLVLPAQASLFGKYPSQMEARQACREWANAGGKYEAEIEIIEEVTTNPYNVPPVPYHLYQKSLITEFRRTGEYEWKQRDRRYCKHETSTKQYLGSEKNIRKNKQEFRDSKNKFKWQVKKHFYY